ncbi:MAG: hypothetical protein U1F33_16740 [Alphaproteobacteria bacterium]
MKPFVHSVVIAALAAMAISSAAFACGAGQTTMGKPITTTAETKPPMTPMPPAPLSPTGG